MSHCELVAEQHSFVIFKPLRVPLTKHITRWRGDGHPERRGEQHHVCVRGCLGVTHGIDLPLFHANPERWRQCLWQQQRLGFGVLDGVALAALLAERKPVCVKCRLPQPLRLSIPQLVSDRRA